MPTTTRHGVCSLSIDELRHLHRVRSTRQALRHTERIEDVLILLARDGAEAAAAGRRVRADQVLDSARRAMARTLAAIAEPAFAEHALTVVRREFDDAAERAMARAARTFSSPPPTQTAHGAHRRDACGTGARRTAS